MSPRPGPRRPIVSIRLAESGVDYIDRLAEKEGVLRSEMIRLLLAYGVKHWPKGWRG
jgi:hypothetical protein